MCLNYNDWIKEVYVCWSVHRKQNDEWRGISNIRLLYCKLSQLLNKRTGAKQNNSTGTIPSRVNYNEADISQHFKRTLLIIGIVNTGVYHINLKSYNNTTRARIETWKKLCFLNHVHAFQKIETINHVSCRI